ncbi:MAG: aldehyde dehydrogenase family protein [Frankia sp.]
MTGDIHPAMVSPVADWSGAGEARVHNPANRAEVVGSYPVLAPADVDHVVTVAGQAQRSWAQVPPAERFERLEAALAAVDLTDRDRLLTREQGKPLAESTRELGYLGFSTRLLSEHLSWLTDGEELMPSAFHRSRVYRDPVGVVGIITPWNFPIGIPVVSVAPALVAGNAVVLHLPATAPLAALDVFGQIAALLPEGVLSAITSPDTGVARRLVEHSAVRHVHFTGSTMTGRIVAREGAETLTGLTLELGGNDAGIVLEDAVDDQPDLFARLVAGAFGNAGQACIALKRLYVPAARVGEVVEGLGAALATQVVGDGLNPATTMGPLHTRAQRDKVRGLLDRARADGGTVLEFGALAGDPELGNFLRPALVTGVDASSPIVAEEQFGPALPIVGYSSIDEAVALANDSRYGLGSSVWSSDVTRAAGIARRLDTGMTFINAHGGAGIDGRVPFGGTKDSGLGRGGANRAGLEVFTDAHAVVDATR